MIHKARRFFLLMIILVIHSLTLTCGSDTGSDKQPDKQVSEEVSNLMTAFSSPNIRLEWDDSQVDNLKGVRIAYQSGDTAPDSCTSPTATVMNSQFYNHAITPPTTVGMHHYSYRICTVRTDDVVSSGVSKTHTITIASFTAQAIATSIVSAPNPISDENGNLILPSVPSGFRIQIRSSSDINVIDTNGMINPCGSQTTLVFTVTRISDSQTADTTGIIVTVPNPGPPMIPTAINLPPMLSKPLTGHPFTLGRYKAKIGKIQNSICYSYTVSRQLTNQENLFKQGCSDGDVAVCTSARYSSWTPPPIRAGRM